MNDLIARVEALERQNRRLKYGAAALSLSLVGLAAVQTSPKTVATTRLTLVDEENRVRAAIENTLPGGGHGAINPVLSFYDLEGRVRVRLGLGPHGATLETIDENGKSREILGGPAMRPATEK